MNNNLKQAIKIANKLKKEVELFAYNVKSYTHEQHYLYAKCFDSEYNFFNTYTKNLHGNKEIGKGKEKDIIISDQVYFYILDKYDMYLKDFDRFTCKKAMDSFINNGTEMFLNEKANELINKYELFEINEMHNKLSIMLVEKDESVNKAVKI